MTNKYDAIVIGAGHNGLTNGAYLAKAGLKVLMVEQNEFIGGATVSLPKYRDWKYSNCSYVCSLLRPEIYRDLNLAKYGLQVVPYGGSVTIAQNGDYIGNYDIHQGDLTVIAHDDLIGQGISDCDGFRPVGVVIFREPFGDRQRRR